MDFPKRLPNLKIARLHNERNLMAFTTNSDANSVSVSQYIPKYIHTVFALLCFVVVIHWLIFPYPSGLLHWHCGNLTIAPVPIKQPWWIWINTSCEFIMNYCITTTKQSTTKPCAYFLGYTVCGCHVSDPVDLCCWIEGNLSEMPAREPLCVSGQQVGQCKDGWMRIG